MFREAVTSLHPWKLTVQLCQKQEQQECLIGQ